MTSSETLNELNNIFYSKQKDIFSFKTINMFLTVLVLSSLFDMLCNYSKTSILFFVINLCLLQLYNMNNKMFNEFNISLFIDSLRYNLVDLISFTTLKIKNSGNWIFDKMFSKSTQFVLKVIFKIVKTNIVTKYEFYRNKLFNPQLLNETNSEYIYCVPLYLDGVNYKIPIVVEKHKTKNPPLMILNKDEEDITNKINEFLGPNYDFFGMVLKPKHFSEKSLSFMLEDGSDITMEENDIMIL
jgi:hypothetical protein